MIALVVIIFLLGILMWYLLKKKRNNKIERNLTIDDKYNAVKVSKNEELDRILDKISSHGYKSLTKREKDFLKNF